MMKELSKQQLEFISILISWLDLKKELGVRFLESDIKKFNVLLLIRILKMIRDMGEYSDTDTWILNSVRNYYIKDIKSTKT